uniref:Uncharacterized protein n=1 Tax=Pelusios castaneus TaxID=367368 RepID=A0A8C8RL90_9SAUR
RIEPTGPNSQTPGFTPWLGEEGGGFVVNMGCLWGVFVHRTHSISPSSPPAANKLRCRHCALDEPYIGCLPGASECTPKAGNPCLTVNISYSEVQYFIQGCIENRNRCGMVKESMVPGFLINVTCCSHASFCNDIMPQPAG